MGRDEVEIKRTEELLASSSLLNDLDEAGTELLDGRNVLGEHTHLSGLGWDVDLDTVFAKHQPSVAYNPASTLVLLFLKRSASSHV